MTTTLESGAAKYKRNRPVGYCCNQAITLETCPSVNECNSDVMPVTAKVQSRSLVAGNCIRRDFENEAATAAGEATRISTTE